MGTPYIIYTSYRATNGSVLEGSSRTFERATAFQMIKRAERTNAISCRIVKDGKVIDQWHMSTKV